MPEIRYTINRYQFSDAIYYDHAADCGVPISSAKLNYSSTLEGSVLILTCENDTSTNEQTLSVTCHSDRSWIPNPADFACSSFTTAPSGISIIHEEHNYYHVYNNVILNNQIFSIPK